MRAKPADFKHDDRSCFDENEVVEDFWEPVALAARAGDLVPLAKRLLGIDERPFVPPPLARRAIVDAIRRLENKTRGKRPAFGKAEWQEAAEERRARELQDEQRREAYQRHKARFMATPGRTPGGFKKKAIEHAARELAPEHNKVEERNIARVLKRRRRDKRA